MWWTWSMNHAQCWHYWNDWHWCSSFWKQEDYSNHWDHFLLRFCSISISNLCFAVYPPIFLDFDTIEELQCSWDSDRAFTFWDFTAWEFSELVEDKSWLVLWLQLSKTTGEFRRCWSWHHVVDWMIYCSWWQNFGRCSVDSWRLFH